MLNPFNSNKFTDLKSIISFLNQKVKQYYIIKREYLEAFSFAAAAAKGIFAGHSAKVQGGFVRQGIRKINIRPFLIWNRRCGIIDVR